MNSLRDYRSIGGDRIIDEIVHYVPVLDGENSYGGPASVAQDLAAAQRSSGARTILISSRHRASRPARNHPHERVYPAVHLGGARRPALVFGLGTVLAVVRTRADRVHLHAGKEPQSLLIGVLLRLLRRDVILHTHGMLANIGQAGRLERLVVALAYGRVRVAFALTAGEEASLRSCLKRTLVRRLGNGVSVRPTKIPRADRDGILFCGRLAARKRPELFLHMASEMLACGDDLRFDILGPDEGRLTSVLEACGSDARIRYLGSVGRRSARERIATAQVLVVTSEREPFGMVIAEALASGTPVVAIDGGLELQDELCAAGVLRVADQAGLADAVRDAAFQEDAAWEADTERMRTYAEQFLGLPAIIDEIERTCHVA